MKKQKGYTISELLIVIVLLSTIIHWPANTYRLMNCDFKSDYACEIKHGIGLVIPPAAIITVWADTDKNKPQQ